MLTYVKVLSYARVHYRNTWILAHCNPSLYRLPLDAALPVWASAVLFQQMCTSSEEITHCDAPSTHGPPALLEVLEMLKFMFRYERLTLHEGSVTKEMD